MILLRQEVRPLGVKSLKVNTAVDALARGWSRQNRRDVAPLCVKNPAVSFRDLVKETSMTGRMPIPIVRFHNKTRDKKLGWLEFE
jgi:hypothetical protein